MSKKKKKKSQFEDNRTQREKRREKTLRDQRRNFWNRDIGRRILAGESIGSWHLMEWVLRTSNLAGNAKLVAVQLAQRYSPDVGGSKHLSYTNLTDLTGLSRATIAKCIRLIQESGEWDIQRTPVTPTVDKKKINFYKPNLLSTYSREYGPFDKEED